MAPRRNKFTVGVGPAAGSSAAAAPVTAGPPPKPILVKAIRLGYYGHIARQVGTVFEYTPTPHWETPVDEQGKPVGEPVLVPAQAGDPLPSWVVPVKNRHALAEVAVEAPDEVQEASVFNTDEDVI